MHLCVRTYIYICENKYIKKCIDKKQQEVHTRQTTTSCINGYVNKGCEWEVDLVSLSGRPFCTCGKPHIGLVQPVQKMCGLRAS